MKQTIEESWDKASRNDRVFLLNALHINGRVAFQITQLAFKDLEKDIQQGLKELGK